MMSEEGMNVYGAVTWGQFFVFQGFNENRGWMHTCRWRMPPICMQKRSVAKAIAIFLSVRWWIETGNRRKRLSGLRGMQYKTPNDPGIFHPSWTGNGLGKTSG